MSEMSEMTRMSYNKQGRRSTLGPVCVFITAGPSTKLFMSPLGHWWVPDFWRASVGPRRKLGYGGSR
jgi:hypothetical protein